MSALLKPASYILVICLGFLLKRLGFFEKEDHRLLSKIMINITLPCAIVQAFETFEREASMFIIVGIGFLCALLPMLLMYLLTVHDPIRLRTYRMLNIGGYNIGCFSLPLVQIFFGDMGVVTACMFDTGNAVMMTGGSYAVTSTLLGIGDHRESAWEIAIKFLKSIPFDVYMLMFAMVALDIPIPEAMFTLTRPAGQANAFIAMLMIGMMFEPEGDPVFLKEAGREILLRFAFAGLSAWVLYRFTPFSLLVRKTLAVVCFAPLSSLAPLYTDRCGADTALASFTNSLSILVSLVCMLTLSIWFIA